ncbi:MAG: glycosyltransferase family 4 protein [Acidobacteriota bacterium]
MLKRLDAPALPCYVKSAMRIAGLLPHVEVFGGVRRYLEIGNELTQRGHLFVLFTPNGERPDWLEFKGVVKPFDAIGHESFDISLCSEYSILPHFDRLQAAVRFFYFVLAGHRKERETARRPYQFLGNSEGLCRRIERKYRVRCHRASGGVNPQIFHPLSEEDSSGAAQPSEKPPRSPEFRILCYGRFYRKRKGTRQVIKAAESLRREFPGLRLVFFDTLVGQERRDPRQLIRTLVPHDFYLNLPQEKMAWLFSQADLFVSAERRAGWANTAAEAMACRLPVVCTRSGTRDFAFHGRTALVVPFGHPWLLRRQIERLILNEPLRRRLGRAGYDKIMEFTWEALAIRLEEIFRAALAQQGPG